MIDSPDIPLNVSRSYLQSDSNVKKISTYISKKVSDRLLSIFKNDRKDFEAKWDDLKIFINYGMLTEEDFYDRANKFALLKDTDVKYYTFEEYQTLIKGEQTDKDGNVIYLYANNVEEQYSYIEAAKNKGYNVLLMDGQLDVALIGLLERKIEKSRFTRVDSDVIDRLIVKDDIQPNTLEHGKSEILTMIFRSQLPKVEKVNFNVDVQSLGEKTAPILITQSEYMRRMKEMARIQPGMSFYGDMPDMFNVVVNVDNSLVKGVLTQSGVECAADLTPLNLAIEDLNKRYEELRKAQEGKKTEEISTEEKETLNDVEQKIANEKAKKESVLSDFATRNKVVRQLVDLALLQNNMLKGEALNNFIKRSLEIIG